MKGVTSGTLTKEDKDNVAKVLHNMIAQMIYSDITHKIEVESDRGLEEIWCNVNTNFPWLAFKDHNGTATLTIKINGGARNTSNLE